MFNKLFSKFRTSTLFEKLLLFTGIAIGIVGFWLINKVYYIDPVFSWDFVDAIFLWLLLIFMVILTASNESIKEELSFITKEHIEETKLIKEEIKLVKEELKLLNANLVKKKH